MDRHSDQYHAIVCESNGSCGGREVILDLIPCDNIRMSRALDMDKVFLGTLDISSVLSCYLIYPNGTHGFFNVAKPLSFLFSYLKSLPDVRKKSLSFPERSNKQEN